MPARPILTAFLNGLSACLLLPTGERKKYAEDPSETYGVYKGYNKDGIVHIQRADVFEQDWERAKNVLKLGDRLAAALGELM